MSPIGLGVRYCAANECQLLGELRNDWRALKAFAVGTAVTGRPPHRTARAEFPHAAPTLGV
jgi:hypothetical protein